MRPAFSFSDWGEILLQLSQEPSKKDDRSPVSVKKAEQVALVPASNRIIAPPLLDDEEDSSESTVQESKACLSDNTLGSFCCRVCALQAQAAVEALESLSESKELASPPQRPVFPPAAITGAEQTTPTGLQNNATHLQALAAEGSRDDDISDAAHNQEISQAIHQLELKFRVDRASRTEERLTQLDTHLADVHQHVLQDAHHRRIQLMQRQTELAHEYDEEQELVAKALASLSEGIKRKNEVIARDLDKKFKTYVKTHALLVASQKASLEQREKEKQRKKAEAPTTTSPPKTTPLPLPAAGSRAEANKGKEGRTEAESEVNIKGKDGGRTEAISEVIQGKGRENKTEAKGDGRGYEWVQDQTARKRILAHIQLKNELKQFLESQDSERSRARVALESNLRLLIQQVTLTEESVSDKSRKLQQHLRDLKSKEGGHSKLYKQALLFVAQNLVQDQWEKVRTRPALCWPFALLMGHVYLAEPLFLDILLGVFHASCLYTIPQYVNKEQPSLRGLSVRDFKRLQGYAIDSDEEPDEDDDEDREADYLAKMAAIITLYTAFMQINLPEHPHGISEAWTWLARILNQPPVDATAALLDAFLRTGGYHMQKHFPRQFPKCLRLIQSSFCARLPEDTEAQKTAKGRVDTFCRMAFTDGHTVRISPPEGLEMKKSQTNSNISDSYRGASRASTAPW